MKYIININLEHIIYYTILYYNILNNYSNTFELIYIILFYQYLIITIQTPKTVFLKGTNFNLYHSTQHTILKYQKVFTYNECTPVPKLVEYLETIEEEENKRKRYWLIFCSIIICFSFLWPRIKCYLISRQSAPVKL